MKPTNPPFSGDNPDVCDDDAQRCLLYLFGELDTAASQRLEQELEHDARLREQFASQAQWIATLGESALTNEPVASEPTASEPVASELADEPPMPAKPVVDRSRSQRSLRSYGWIAAVAASLVCLLWWSQSQHNTAGVAAEELLQTQQLADAWLETYSADLNAVDGSFLHDVDLDPDMQNDPEQNDPDQDDLTEDWQQPAAPPDWMVVALSGMDAEDRDATEVSGG